MIRFVWLFLAACICITLAASSLQAQPPATPTVAQSTKGKVDPNALREMLVKGLKATRKDEKDYIDGVVLRVVKRKLSLASVYASFSYARTQKPRYPFPYFVYSVETLAKRQRQNR